METIVRMLAGTIVTNISPVLIGEFTAFVDRLDAKAKETSNPYDDIAVGLLKALLGAIGKAF